jgi:hypothetical protein
MIEMRDGANDLAYMKFITACPSLNLHQIECPFLLAADSIAAIRHIAEFAFISSAQLDPSADLFPILRVARQIFRLDGH